MTEQKCAKIVAGEGLVSLTGPNFYIELPTDIFVVYKYFTFDESENVVCFVYEDDANEFVEKNIKLKDGYNYGFEKIKLKW